MSLLDKTSKITCAGAYDAIRKQVCLIKALEMIEILESHSSKEQNTRETDFPFYSWNHITSGNKNIDGHI